jgi:hypothetical protein
VTAARSAPSSSRQAAAGGRRSDIPRENTRTSVRDSTGSGRQQTPQKANG